MGEPAEFRFLGSTTRREDRVGQLIEEPEDDIDELSPVETTLSWIGQEGVTHPCPFAYTCNGSWHPGTWAVSRDETHRWKLEFNVRTAGDEEQ